MDEVTNPKSSNPKSVKKESLQQLKVRTDLKGGSRLAAAACCTKTHHCAAFNFGAAVINPAGSPSRGGHHISEPTSHGTEHPGAPCLLKTADEFDESGRRRIQAVGSRCDGQHKNALIPKLREPPA
jgi:hypothetical protein